MPTKKDNKTKIVSQKFKITNSQKVSKALSSPETIDPDFLEAYQESLKEREEVYRRLAES